MDVLFREDGKTVRAATLSEDEISAEVGRVPDEPVEGEDDLLVADRGGNELGQCTLAGAYLLTRAAHAKKLARMAPKKKAVARDSAVEKMDVSVSGPTITTLVSVGSEVVPKKSRTDVAKDAAEGSSEGRTVRASTSRDSVRVKIMEKHLSGRAQGCATESSGAKEKHSYGRAQGVMESSASRATTTPAASASRGSKESTASTSSVTASATVAGADPDVAGDDDQTV